MNELISYLRPIRLIVSTAVKHNYVIKLQKIEQNSYNLFVFSAQDIQANGLVIVHNQVQSAESPSYYIIRV